MRWKSRIIYRMQSRATFQLWPLRPKGPHKRQIAAVFRWHWFSSLFPPKSRLFISLLKSLYVFFCLSESFVSSFMSNLVPIPPLTAPVCSCFVFYGVRRAKSKLSIPVYLNRYLDFQPGNEFWQASQLITIHVSRFLQSWLITPALQRRACSTQYTSSFVSLRDQVDWIAY